MPRYNEPPMPGEFIVPLDPEDIVYEKILDERRRQRQLIFDGKSCNEFDKTNSRNDWVAYISAYVGRAGKVSRNEREDCDFESNLIKVAALCLAAIEAHYKGYC